MQVLNLDEKNVECMETIDKYSVFGEWEEWRA